MIQIVVHLKEGETRQTKDDLAAAVTDAVTGVLHSRGPVEVWLREYPEGRVYLGGEAV